MKTSNEPKLENLLKKKFEELGAEKYDSLRRFFAKYQALSTRKNYAIALCIYFRWLHANSIMTIATAARARFS